MTQWIGGFWGLTLALLLFQPSVTLALPVVVGSPAPQSVEAAVGGGSVSVAIASASRPFPIILEPSVPSLDQAVSIDLVQAGALVRDARMRFLEFLQLRPQLPDGPPLAITDWHDETLPVLGDPAIFEGIYSRN